jgi:hypothetical protein
MMKMAFFTCCLTKMFYCISFVFISLSRDNIHSLPKFNIMTNKNRLLILI